MTFEGLGPGMLPEMSGQLVRSGLISGLLTECSLLFLRNPEVLRERIMKRQWLYRLGARVGRATFSYALGSEFELSSVYHRNFSLENPVFLSKLEGKWRKYSIFRQMH